MSGSGCYCLGTSLAIATTLIAGAAIYFTAGNLEGRAEEIFEGVATQEMKVSGPHLFMITVKSNDPVEPEKILYLSAYFRKGGDEK